MSAGAAWSEGGRATSTVRPAVPADLSAIARVHARAFLGFFLTLLGEPFLRQYYRLTLEHAGGLLLVAEQGGEIVGFASGFLRPADFYESLSRSKWRLAPAIAWGVLRRPSTIGRILSASRQVRGGQAAKAPWSGAPAELASIGVDPDRGGQGIGTTLLRAFAAAANSRHADYVYLTTDAEHNEPVNAFYLRNGFDLVTSYTAAGGRRMNLYARRLRDAPASGE